jgi:hypothetical protein
VASVPPTALPHPLRLPLGTVRALIAIIVTVTYAYLLVREQTVPPVLVNSVVVVIAFYFGSRATAPPPTLPPGEVRPRRPRVVPVLLLIGLVGLAAWFLRPDPTWGAMPEPLRSVLEVLAGYVAGLVVAWVLQRRVDVSSFRRRLATLVRDLLAVGALGLTGYICVTLATGQMSVFGDRAHDVLALVVTFYFGSRVSNR